MRTHWGLKRDGIGYLIAIALVLAMTVVGWFLHRKLSLADTNVLMLYLLAVLWIAARYTRGAAILASVLGVLAFDVIFVPPYYRLTVYDPQYLVTFAAMLITALVISALTHLDRRLRGRRIETHLPRDFPLLQIDSVALDQVLTNLIDNAIQYTPADAPIELIAQQIDHQIMIDVADRGPGIPDSVRDRVFQK